MKAGKRPPHNLRQWLEFLWLWFSNPTFRASPNKRRAYYEHCVAKHLSRPWS